MAYNSALFGCQGAVAHVSKYQHLHYNTPDNRFQAQCFQDTAEAVLKDPEF
jgi:hypothetical protein